MSLSWDIKPSHCSLNTINPIRNIVDKIVRPVDHQLPHIDLALGDPAVFGNLPPAQLAVDAVHKAVNNTKTHGYAPSMGTLVARDAVAKFMSTSLTTFSANDIYITSGASQAILICCQLLCNPGDALLIPTPGFSLYETICGHLGLEAKKYPLLPDNQWEIDLEALEKLVTPNTRGILINNPGNPTGSNYSKEHLVEIANFARKHKLPVISDEMYAHLVFGKEVFTPFSDICEDIPTFVISGLAKRFLVPGWRVGWIAVCDRQNVIASLRTPIVSLTQVIVGSSTIPQAAIPSIVTLGEEYFSTLTRTLETHAKCVYEACLDISGLKPTIPQGAMYMMVGIDPSHFQDIANDAEFCQKLLTEQNIMLLPGSCFGIKNFFRIVFCAPEEKLLEFASRLKQFCNDHHLKN